MNGAANKRGWIIESEKFPIPSFCHTSDLHRLSPSFSPLPFLAPPPPHVCFPSSLYPSFSSCSLNSICSCKPHILIRKKKNAGGQRWWIAFFLLYSLPLLTICSGGNKWGKCSHVQYVPFSDVTEWANIENVCFCRLRIAARVMSEAEQFVSSFIQ